MNHQTQVKVALSIFAACCLFDICALIGVVVKLSIR